MHLYRYHDERDDEPLAYMMRNRWWSFAAVAEAEDEYGFDESCPWFMWLDRSSIFLPDGSSRWVEITEPYIMLNRFDNRDGYCGTTHFLLPASQRYGLRLTRWQQRKWLDFEKEAIAEFDDVEPF